HISLALFEEEEKKGIKGVLFKREDGRYNCNMVLDGKLKIEGIVDFSNKAMELDFVPVSDDRWLVKIKGGMESNGSISIYSRIDKIKAGDVELIGDIWISYLSGNVSEFSMKTENFLVNRKPFWDIMVNGKFSRFDNKITIDRVKWGDNITLTGDLFTKTPCPMDLRILIKGLELAEIAKMLSVKKDELTGRLEGDIGITGSRNKATVKGRVYIGEGTLGEMKFRSLFATLKGNLPVISIVDSRVVKDWGNILVSGEIDFSKLRGGKAFDDLLFETDNKVAVWENWQIAKEETLNIVEASKDRMTVITSLEDDDLTEGFRLKDSQQKELGFKYKLDTGNSIKLEFEEDRDFFGVEHKIQF
ncbi:MAG: hypothetical protein KAI70_04715, partial [Candidatus Omnitrophica bacterium]|nr:hypothetical protein [Candidatus Omnitrophota bacterium]